MGKKTKAKKQKQYKTRELRQEEIQEIKNKIQQLGLTEEMSYIKDFYNILNNFVETGEGQDGKIKLTGLKRILNYILTNTLAKKCLIKLEFDDNI